MGLMVKSAAITDIGKVRDINEDNYCIYEENIGLYIVADGMGGHKSGEIASATAIDIIRDHIKSYLTDEFLEQTVKGILFEAFNRANREIYKKSTSDYDCEGMGTTATVVLIVEDKFYIGHIGDSRAYLFRNKELRQITEDHSLVAELVKNGSITEREAMKHPRKNIITRSLGNDETVKVDIFSMDFKKGDMIILCTDGLTNFVDKNELQRLLIEEEDCFEVCNNLVSLANKRGGYDNITVLIVKKQDISTAEGW